MPKPNVLKKAAKEMILNYLKSLFYQKAAQGELSNAEADSVCSVAALGRYLSSNEKYKIFVFEPNEIFDQDQYKGFTILSALSFRKAVNELMDEGLIENKDNTIQYVLPKEEQERLFPILKMAENIEISPLPWNDIAFFKVRRGLSAEIANYINQQFFGNDIYAVSLGDIVMCIDIAIPENSKIVSKRRTVNERVTDCLRTFSLKELPRINASKEGEIGFTAEEIEQQNMNRAIAQRNEQEKRKADTGGKIKDGHKRDVKKRLRIKKQTQ